MKTLSDAIVERAREFARCYTAVTEALVMEGVPEDIARVEARMTAYLAIFETWELDGPD